jgi:hypothetical protein
MLPPCCPLNQNLFFKISKEQYVNTQVEDDPWLQACLLHY